MKKKYKALLSIFAICAVTFSLVWFPSQAVAKDVTLKFADYLPSSYRFSTSIDRIADYINTNGKNVGLKCKYYKEVYNIKELLPAVDSGELDMFCGIDSFWENDIPVLGALALPFVMDKVFSLAGEMYTIFGRDSAWFKIESEQLAKRGLKLISILPRTEREFMTIKPLRKLEDFKGMKIRCSGGVERKTLELLGAKAVSMPSGELYGAMQRGMVDGVVGSTGSTFLGRHIYEVCPYMTRVPGLFQTTWSLIMRIDTWDSLSPAQRDVVLRAGDLAMLDYSGGLMAESLREWELFAEKGIKTTVISGKERERWKEATRPAFDWYIKKVGPLAKESIKALGVLNK